MTVALVIAIVALLVLSWRDEIKHNWRNRNW